MTRTKPLAVNPLPWFMTGMSQSLTEATLRQALGDLRDVGFRAMHTDVPADMTTAAYGALLAEFGFRAAPGYFARDFHVAAKLPGILEEARLHAAMLNQLDVDTTFVAGSIDMARMTAPGVGENSSADRIARIADALAQVAEAMSVEGVRPGLHQHISMTVETEWELREILDRTAGSALGFGPDTGHLVWGGMVAHHIIADYADRVVAVHLKDVDLGGLQSAIRLGDDLMSAMNARHIYTEPGRGVIDFPAVLDALPADFDGWFVLEVDVPNLPDRVESSRASWKYLTDLAPEWMTNA